MPTPARRKKRTTFKRGRGMKGKLDAMHRKMKRSNKQLTQSGYVK